MIVLCLLVLINVLSARSPEPYARVQVPLLNEESAVVASPGYPDLLWVLEDSGNGPYLFPLNSGAELILPEYLRSRDEELPRDYLGFEVLGARNIDWESLAHLGDTLVIGDLGNNYNFRRDLALYFLLEPNPHSAVAAQPFLRLAVSYPSQKAYPPRDWIYDCEAIFSFHGKLYFLSKNRSDAEPDLPAPRTSLYRLDTRKIGEVNPLTHVMDLADLGGWVTGADISPGEDRLAMLVQNPLVSTVWIFQTPREGDRLLEGIPLVIPMPKVKQVEGICFLNADTLLVTNEQRDWFQFSLTP